MSLISERLWRGPCDCLSDDCWSACIEASHSLNMHDRTTGSGMPARRIAAKRSKSMRLMMTVGYTTPQKRRITSYQTFNILNTTYSIAYYGSTCI